MSAAASIRTQWPERGGPAYGRVDSVRGLMIEIAGPLGILEVGGRVEVETGDLAAVSCEIIGFRGDRAVAMPFSHCLGVRRGCRVVLRERTAALYPDNGWPGRMIDAFGFPVDGGGPLGEGSRPALLHAGPLLFQGGEVSGATFGTAHDGATQWRGERIGVVPGPDADRSRRLAGLVRNCSADIAVIALIGWSGREAIIFVETDLDPAIMRRTVVVLASEDESPLTRREAAFAAMAIAEHYRDEGRSVALFMDSLTGLVEASCDIAMAAGAPIAVGGDAPVVLADVMHLVTRAGAGTGPGSITAFFVLTPQGAVGSSAMVDALRGSLDRFIVSAAGSVDG